MDINLYLHVYNLNIHCTGYLTEREREKERERERERERVVHE